MFKNITTKRRSLLINFILIVMIAIVYVQVGTFEFVDFDDHLYVTENSYVQRGLTKEGFIWAFNTHHAGNWHPLTWLSHMMDAELYGLNPAGHHYTNVAFHIANTLILFFILFRMTGALWKSAVVAALFAIHPLHVESVAWVSERKDVLSTFFGLLTIIAYDRYVKTLDLKYYLLVIIFLIIGLMCKPMLVSFPFVLLLLDFWPLKRIQFKNNYHLQPERSTYYGFKGIFPLIVEKIPLFILSVISCVLTFIVQKNGGAVVPLEALPLKTRIANALISYVSYALKAIWPDKLAYYYPYSINTFSVWQICGAALLITSVILGAIYLSRQYPYTLVGLFWYLGTLVPVIGLVQVTNQAMADRYTYIPLIGLFIVVVWGISDIIKKWQYRKIILIVSTVVILSALTTRAFFQARHWKNSIALFENAVKVTEHNYHALNNLATALANKGKYDKAFLYLNQSLKMNPKRKDVRMNLANILFLKGKPDKALSQYREVLQTDTKNADAYYNIACVLSSQKKYNEAVLYYKETLKIDPEYLKAHYNLGNIYFSQGKTTEAFMHYAEAIKIKPDYVQAYNKLGLILLRQGKFNEARGLFSKALEIDPKFSKARINLDIVQKLHYQDKR
jgi:protein O-mannosyl-transferase